MSSAESCVLDTPADPCRPAAEDRPHVRDLRGQDPLARSDLAGRRRRAGVHGRRAATSRGAGPSGRRASSSARPAAVRCDRRPRVPRARPRPHARADGAAPDARRRPRSRLQQRQHLRRPVAAGARGAHRRERLGAALLRAGAEGQRRRAGDAMDAAAGRRLHLFLQRRALAVRRHDPLAARAGAGAPARAPAVGGAGRLDQPARAAGAARARHRRNTPSTTGTGRDGYDVRGRTAHESLFNVANGTYRGPNSQQGYSPFTTWTRGLAWAMLGFAEQIEFLATVPTTSSTAHGGRAAIETLDARGRARHVRFLHRHGTAADGVPYWDTGAPGLAALGDWAARPADPFNDHEPVDSSAAAIAAQGLLRLGARARERGEDGAPLRAGRARACSTRCSTSAAVSVDQPMRIRACCCTRSITVRTAGTTCRRARAFRAASRASGATITCVRRRCSCGASREASRISRSSGRPTGREEPALAPDRAAARVALVTGGTRGIGLGIARALAHKAGRLALGGVRPPRMCATSSTSFEGRRRLLPG